MAEGVWGGTSLTDQPCRWCSANLSASLHSMHAYAVAFCRWVDQLHCIAEHSEICALHLSFEGHHDQQVCWRDAGPKGLSDVLTHALSSTPCSIMRLASDFHRAALSACTLGLSAVLRRRTAKFSASGCTVGRQL